MELLDQISSVLLGCIIGSYIGTSVVQMVCYFMWGQPPRLVIATSHIVKRCIVSVNRMLKCLI